MRIILGTLAFILTLCIGLKPQAATLEIPLTLIKPNQYSASFHYDSIASDTLIQWNLLTIGATSTAPPAYSYYFTFDFGSDYGCVGELQFSCLAGHPRAERYLAEPLDASYYSVILNVFADTPIDTMAFKPIFQFSVTELSPVVATPLPGALALFVGGLAVLGWRIRKRDRH